MKDTVNNNTLCMVPFRELHINPNGQFRNCCIQKDVMGNIDLKVESPVKWFANNEPMEALRQSLIQGEKHSTCSKCWSLEDQGLQSYRQNWNKQYFESSNTDLNSRIEIIDLRLGNRCNLKCRMCNSNWSNQISDQIAELRAQGINNTWTQMPVLGTIKQSDEFLNDLFYFVKQTPSIREIKFAGGEPFAMEEVEEFLYRLVENNIVDLEISLLTNVTLVKDRIVNTLEKFKSTHIQCSIDGIGKHLEYQRHPSKWEVVERNFIKLYNAKLTVNLTPCWSNLNVLSMSEFLRWTSNFPKSHVAYNEVNHPSYLDWRFVPLAARQDEISKLSSLTLHSKVHQNYKTFIEKFKTEVKEYTDSEITQYRDAISSWDAFSKVKYQELYSWNQTIIK